MDNLSVHNLEIIREIDAPIDKVWKAWTDPQELKMWWGPNGVTNPTCVWEAEAGGDIHIVMLAGDELGELSGQEWPMTGSFVEVIPGKKLVFRSNAIIDGKPVMDHMCTVTFEELGDKTRLSLNVEVLKATPEAEGPLSGMSTGWNQSLDKLTQQLEDSASHV